MRTAKLHRPQWIGVGVAILWQLALVVGFFAMAIWLWPADLLETPLTQLTLEDVLRAIVSATFLSAGITSLYLIVVVPLVRVYTDLYTRDRN